MSQNTVVALFEEIETLSQQINELKKEIKRIDSLREQKAVLEEKLSNLAKNCRAELEKVGA